MKLDRKFWDDTVWNYGSLAVVASSGLFINFIIAGKMGAQALGVFNQTYAVYVIAAQIAAMAVHDSVQKHVAQHEADRNLCNVVSAAALIHSALTGLLCALVVYVSSTLIGDVLDSPATATGIALTAPGLFLFSVNKVLLGILNGQRKMRFYAIGQAIRGFGIFLVCFAIAFNNMAASWLGISFTLTEAVLFPYLLFVGAPRTVNWRFEGELKNWTRLHFSFGSRAFVNGLLSEAYIRVDVIMLGMFLSDEKVGIYSFAAMFVEGIYQLSVVIRTISNPVLVKLLSPLDKLALGAFVRRISGLSFLATAAAATVLFVVFPYLDMVFNPEMIEAGYPALMILLGGMTVFSIFVPTDQILLQAGWPGRQSLMMLMNILLNVILNFMFIPIYGLIGAASATAISFVGAGLLLNVLAWRFLGLKGGLLVAK
ncbi:MAG: oligosaccharide flippase family protein [Methylocystaceae bacterium]|nr:oligosaccharide flippase family protein [Methylocystaceae bacterium]